MAYQYLKINGEEQADGYTHTSMPMRYELTAITENGWEIEIQRARSIRWQNIQQAIKEAKEWLSQHYNISRLSIL